MSRWSSVPAMAVLILASTSIASGLWYWSGRQNPAEEFKLDQLSADDRSRVACGPVAVALAAQLSGVFMEPGALIGECRLTSKGASPDDLVKLGADHGLDIRRVQWGWQELSDHSSPVVLHVHGTHYVTAHPGESPDGSSVRGELVRIYDPSRAASWWSREQLEGCWDGLALTVKPQVPGGGIAVDRWWVDVGQQDSSQQARFVVPVRNDYPERAVLQIVHTSCECTSAAFDIPEVDPGESTVLTAFVDLGKKRGPFRERVRFTSQAGASSREWCVTLAGTVIGAVEFSARELPLGDLRPSEVKSTSIVVRDPGDGSLRLLSVKPVLAAPRAIEFSNVEFTRVTMNSAAEHRRKHPVIHENDWLVSFDAKVVDSNYSGKVVSELVVTCERNVEWRRDEFQLSCPIIAWVQ